MSALRMTQADVDAHRRKMAGWGRGTPAQAPLSHAHIVARTAHVTVGRMSIELPLRLPNMLNQRLGPFERARQVKKQRNAVRNNIGGGMLPALPATVTLTRIGPQALDTDGVSASFKAVRDALAELYGVDDGSDLYTWVVQQEKAPRKTYGCRIEVVSR